MAPSYLFCVFLLLSSPRHSTGRWIFGESHPGVPSMAFRQRMGGYGAGIGTFGDWFGHGGGNNGGNDVGAMRGDGNDGRGSATAGGRGNDGGCGGDGGVEGLVFGIPKISIPGISFGGISIPGIEIGFAGVSIGGAGGPSAAPPPGCKQPQGLSSKWARRAMSPEAATSPSS